MKQLKFVIAACALAAVSSPLAAQLQSDPRYEFVDAVRKSDGDKVQELLRSHPASLVNSRDGDGNTALIIAVTRRDPEWTGFLLNQGADPNLAGQNGDTPLIIASRIGFEDAVGWLVHMGAKVDGANKMGETALITAVEQRQTPVVKLLLAAGADPDKQDTAAGYSAREYAVRDPRARQILQMINDAKPKPASAH